MFINIKKTIKELANTAVLLAEEQLSGESGKQKKIMAINYVVSNIPVLLPFKKVVVCLLEKFIDDAIEFAVKQMKNFAQGEE